MGSSSSFKTIHLFEDWYLTFHQEPNEADFGSLHLEKIWCIFSDWIVFVYRMEQFDMLTVAFIKPLTIFRVK